MQRSPPATAHCSLRTAHCALLTAHRALRTAHCAPRTAHRALPTAHCSLRTADRALPTAHCSCLTAHCSSAIAFFSTLAHTGCVRAAPTVAQADLQNGYDGNLALPYWDVLNRPEVNGQVPHTVTCCYRPGAVAPHVTPPLIPFYDRQVLPRLIMDAFPNGVETLRELLQNPADATANVQQAGGRQFREKLWDVGFRIEDPYPSLVRNGVSIGKLQACNGM